MESKKQKVNEGSGSVAKKQQGASSDWDEAAVVERLAELRRMLDEINVLEDAKRLELKKTGTGTGANYQWKSQSLDGPSNAKEQRHKKALLPNVEDDVKMELYTLGGFYCDKETEHECVFTISSFLDSEEPEEFGIQLLKDNGRFSLGKYVMPMSFDIKELASESDLSSEKHALGFVRKCKRHVYCYLVRQEQYQKLKDTTAKIKNCTVQATVGFREIILELFKVYDKENNVSMNITLYLNYLSNEARPHKIYVDWDKESHLSKLLRYRLKSSANIFRNKDILEAFTQMMTADDKYFLWEREYEKTLTVTLEDSGSDVSDKPWASNMSRLEQTFKKKREKAKERRRLKKTKKPVPQPRETLSSILIEAFNNSIKVPAERGKVNSTENLPDKSNEDTSRENEPPTPLTDYELQQRAEMEKQLLERRRRGLLTLLQMEKEERLARNRPEGDRQSGTRVSQQTFEEFLDTHRDDPYSQQNESQSSIFGTNLLHGTEAKIQQSPKKRKISSNASSEESDESAPLALRLDKINSEESEPSSPVSKKNLSPRATAGMEVNKKGQTKIPTYLQERPDAKPSGVHQKGDACSAEARSVSPRSDTRKMIVSPRTKTREEPKRMKQTKIDTSFRRKPNKKRTVAFEENDAYSVATKPSSRSDADLRFETETENLPASKTKNIASNSSLEEMNEIAAAPRKANKVDAKKSAPPSEVSKKNASPRTKTIKGQTKIDTILQRKPSKKRTVALEESDAYSLIAEPSSRSDTDSSFEPEEENLPWSKKQDIAANPSPEGMNEIAVVKRKANKVDAKKSAPPSAVSKRNVSPSTEARKRQTKIKTALQRKVNKKRAVVLEENDAHSETSESSSYSGTHLSFDTEEKNWPTTKEQKIATNPVLEESDEIPIFTPEVNEVVAKRSGHPSVISKKNLPPRTKTRKEPKRKRQTKIESTSRRKPTKKRLVELEEDDASSLMSEHSSTHSNTDSSFESEAENWLTVKKQNTAANRLLEEPNEFGSVKPEPKKVNAKRSERPLVVSKKNISSRTKITKESKTKKQTKIDTIVQRKTDKKRILEEDNTSLETEPPTPRFNKQLSSDTKAENWPTMKKQNIAPGPSRKESSKDATVIREADEFNTEENGSSSAVSTEETSPTSEMRTNQERQEQTKTSTILGVETDEYLSLARRRYEAFCVKFDPALYSKPHLSRKGEANKLSKTKKRNIVSNPLPEESHEEAICTLAKDKVDAKKSGSSSAVPKKNVSSRTKVRKIPKRLTKVPTTLRKKSTKKRSASAMNLSPGSNAENRQITKNGVISTSTSPEKSVANIQNACGASKINMNRRESSLLIFEDDYLVRTRTEEDPKTKRTLAPVTLQPKSKLEKSQKTNRRTSSSSSSEREDEDVSIVSKAGQFNSKKSAPSTQSSKNNFPRHTKVEKEPVKKEQRKILTSPQIKSRSRRLERGRKRVSSASSSETSVEDILIALSADKINSKKSAPSAQSSKRNLPLRTKVEEKEPQRKQQRRKLAFSQRKLKSRKVQRTKRRRIGSGSSSETADEDTSITPTADKLNSMKNAAPSAFSKTNLPHHMKSKENPKRRAPTITSYIQGQPSKDLEILPKKRKADFPKDRSSVLHFKAKLFPETDSQTSEGTKKMKTGSSPRENTDEAVPVTLKRDELNSQKNDALLTSENNLLLQAEPGKKSNRNKQAKTSVSLQEKSRKTLAVAQKSQRTDKRNINFSPLPEEADENVPVTLEANEANFRKNGPSSLVYKNDVSPRAKVEVTSKEPEDQKTIRSRAKSGRKPSVTHKASSTHGIISETSPYSERKVLLDTKADNWQEIMMNRFNMNSAKLEPDKTKPKETKSSVPVYRKNALRTKTGSRGRKGRKQITISPGLKGHLHDYVPDPITKRSTNSLTNDPPTPLSERISSLRTEEMYWEMKNERMIVVNSSSDSADENGPTKLQAASDDQGKRKLRKTLSPVQENSNDAISDAFIEDERRTTNKNPSVVPKKENVLGNERAQPWPTKHYSMVKFRSMLESLCESSSVSLDEQDTDSPRKARSFVGVNTTEQTSTVTVQKAKESTSRSQATADEHAKTRKASTSKAGAEAKQTKPVTDLRQKPNTREIISLNRKNTPIRTGNKTKTMLKVITSTPLNKRQTRSSPRFMDSDLSSISHDGNLSAQSKSKEKRLSVRK